MSSESNAFWDFCKAENSEDEEDNIDLQSRLYAEIYYAPNGQENGNSQLTIKSSAPVASNREILESNIQDHCSKNVNENDTPDLKPSLTAVKNSDVTTKDDRHNSTSVTSLNQKEVDKVDTATAKTLKQCCRNNEPQECDTSKDSMKHEAMADIKVNSDSLQNYIKDAVVKAKEVEAKHVDSSNSKATTTKLVQAPYVCLDKPDGDNNAKTNKKGCVKTKGAENNQDLLKKYSFSKTFINNLCAQKYQNLKRKVCDDDSEGDEGEETTEKEMVDAHAHNTSISEIAVDTKYTVLNKNEKETKKHHSEDLTVLSSQTETDSEESILEVPIPPKPQPVVIQVQDSDDDSTSSSNDSDSSQKHLVALDTKCTRTNNKKLKPMTGAIISDSSHNVLPTHTNEDIVLNCTEVQKGATSIKEIKKMNKEVHLEQSCHNKDQNLSHKSKTNASKHTNKKSGSNFCEGTDKHTLRRETHNEGNSFSTCSLQTEIMNEGNLVHERDKDTSDIDFTADITLTDLYNQEETSRNRKRRRENDDEMSNTRKQKKYSNNESADAETSVDQQSNKTGTKKPESWEEYFFHPMSESLKAFYNESRGQENFDIGDIQSKMSKDPRLWAILDEDLMPHLSRQRFWNVKCSHCHHEGHQRYNCPEPRRPPRCHMCGIQGHTETRCPQKICLTCGKRQGTFRKTCESCRTLYCNMCKAIGHKSTECPDLWRRFHQTTGDTEINVPENLSDVMKPADLLYCCNCTKRGHDSSTCNEFRWSPHFPTPAYVSCYTDDPGCNPIYTAVQEGDIIPLTSSKKAKIDSKSSKSQKYSSELDLKDCHIIYSCGTYTATKKSRQIEKNITPIQDFHLKGLLEKRVTPRFLVSLLNIVKFEVKFFLNAQKHTMLRIRAPKIFTQLIYQIILHWLKLQDDEKRRDLRVHFPKTKREMFYFLSSEWKKLETDVLDPKYLTRQIDQLKRTMTESTNSASSSSVTQRILDFQSKLLQVYHTKPKFSVAATKLRKIISRLRNADNNVDTAVYLNIIIYYNQIFMPYTIPKATLQDFYRKYYKVETKEKKISEKKKKGLNPYDRFLENLRGAGNKAIAASKQKQIPVHITTNLKSSSNVIAQNQQKLTSVSNNPNFTNINDQSNSNIIKPASEKISAQNVQHTKNVTKSSSTNTIELVQVPGSQDISNNSSITGVKAGESNSKTMSPKSVSTLFQDTASSSTSNPRSNSTSNLDSNPCIEIKNTQNKEQKQTAEVEKNNEGGILILNDNFTPESGSGTSKKKKKSKKAKKEKRNLENDLEVNQKQRNRDTAIEDQARRVINEALNFNLPYMNKAAAEVTKRIKDESIKQEHIDVLQKLINLEKDHQKHVTSFCSYLK